MCDKRAVISKSIARTKIAERGACSLQTVVVERNTAALRSADDGLASGRHASPDWRRASTPRRYSQ
jgi:hypothetical protein